MAIELEVTAEFLTWYSGLTEAEQESVRPIVTLLQQFSGTLSRPGLERNDVRGAILGRN